MRRGCDRLGHWCAGGRSAPTRSARSLSWPSSWDTGRSWFNCVAPHADPAALLDSAMGSTERIVVDIGVVPLDGYPAPALVSEDLAVGEAAVVVDDEWT